MQLVEGLPPAFAQDAGHIDHDLDTRQARQPNRFIDIFREVGSDEEQTRIMALPWPAHCANDLVAFRKQRMQQVLANESGSSRQQDPHAFPFLITGYNGIIMEQPFSATWSECHL